MSRVRVILCALVALLVVVENVSCVGHGFGHKRCRERHHHHWHKHRHYNPIPISLSIYDPKGLEVYTKRQNDSFQYFSFEMNINEQHDGTPDMSLNTSEPVYGKYIVRDTKVVIRPGDLLDVKWSIGLSDGSVVQNSRTIYVFSHMISKNCSCEDANLPHTTPKAPVFFVPSWTKPRTTVRPPQRPHTTTEKFTTTGSHLDLENEDYSAEYAEHFDCEIDPSTNRCRSNSMDVRVVGHPQKLVARSRHDEELHALKAIINSLSQQCPRKPKSNFLTMASPQFPIGSSIDYVRRTLGGLPMLEPLATKAVRSAKQNGDVIVFEMETVLDKLMLLYLCQEFGMLSVKDYD